MAAGRIFVPKKLWPRRATLQCSCKQQGKRNSKLLHGDIHSATEAYPDRLTSQSAALCFGNSCRPKSEGNEKTEGFLIFFDLSRVLVTHNQKMAIRSVFRTRDNVKTPSHSPYFLNADQHSWFIN
jgi:hypothetical protein